MNSDYPGPPNQRKKTSTDVFFCAWNSVQLWVSGHWLPQMLFEFQALWCPVGIPSLKIRAATPIPTTFKTPCLTPHQLLIREQKPTPQSPPPEGAGLPA